MKQNIKEIFQKQKKKKKDEYLDEDDHDDLDYYGIRDIETLFDEASEEDYYKPIFVKGFHKGNYKYYESNGDKVKILPVK